MARTQGSNIIQSIEDGTYFIENEVPVGTVDGSNTDFTLAYTPNPASSLELVVNGIQLKAGGEDFTLTSDAIVFVTAPPHNSLILASYRVTPA